MNDFIKKFNKGDEQHNKNICCSATTKEDKLPETSDSCCGTEKNNCCG